MKFFHSDISTILFYGSYLFMGLFMVFSQNQDTNNFSNYRKYGFFIKPVVFQKAKFISNQGLKSLKPISYNTIAFEVGLKKHFRKENNWSFILGVFLRPLPFDNFSISLKKEDIYFDVEYNERFNEGFGHFYLTFPVLIEHKMQVAKNIYFNVNTGFNIFYLSKGSISVYSELVDENEMQIREVFGTYLNTQEKEIQAAFVISSGFYFTTKHFLLQINLEYNKNFQNVFEGEYLFDNLFESPRTRGIYKISGDFIGLSTTIYFKKRYKIQKQLKLE